MKRAATPHRWLLLASVLMPASALLPVAAAAQDLDMSRGGPIAITANDGIEWRQTEQQVVARGNARAQRGTVTVTADRLTAWYRRKGRTVSATAGVPSSPAPGAAATDADGASGAAPGITGVETTADTQGNEIYRLQADGNVRIFTDTDRAQGDRATYDIDQAVLVMTGRDLRLTTPNEVLTARDTLEYWSQKHMAVARGDAVVVTKDARRVAADTLVAYTQPGPTAPAGAAAASAPKATDTAATRGNEAATSGKLEKVEAFGHVSVRTQTDTVTGDRGVYVPETGIARLGGNVRITRGENQLNGAEADVNMKTGIARLTAGSHARVQGLVVPNDTSNQALDNQTRSIAPKGGAGPAVPGAAASAPAPSPGDAHQAEPTGGRR